MNAAIDEARDDANDPGMTGAGVPKDLHQDLKLVEQGSGMLHDDAIVGRKVTSAG
jgi:hypothetical protein